MKRLEVFNERELKVYEDWQENKNRPSLSTVTSLKMYELFLSGHSCDEIVRINGNQFPLGLVLEARIRDGWDEKRDNHLSTLYSSVANKVKQTQLESVEFITDLLAAANRLHGDRIKKFLQTGNPEDLGDISIKSLEGYKKVVEMLMKLTGQEKGGGDGGAKVSVIAQTATITSGEINKPLTSSVADKVLQFLEAHEVDK